MHYYERKICYGMRGSERKQIVADTTLNIQSILTKFLEKLKFLIFHLATNGWLLVHKIHVSIVLL